LVKRIVTTRNIAVLLSGISTQEGITGRAYL